MELYAQRRSSTVLYRDGARSTRKGARSADRDRRYANKVKVEELIDFSPLEMRWKGRSGLRIAGHGNLLEAEELRRLGRL